MSTDTENFWDNLADKYWAKYVAECRATNTRARLSDFMVWAEDNDLIPEPVDYEPQP